MTIASDEQNQFDRIRYVACPLCSGNSTFPDGGCVPDTSSIVHPIPAAIHWCHASTANHVFTMAISMTKPWHCCSRRRTRTKNPDTSPGMQRTIWSNIVERACVVIAG
jgi:hypothetical protein